MTITVGAPLVARAVEEERSRCTAALGAAFIADPLLRWMFPDAEQYLTTFPKLMLPFGGAAFDLGTAHRTDDFRGVALWLPPGVAPDEETLGAVMEEGVTADLRGEVLELFEQVGAVHPQIEHWYLPAIGVDPIRQGRGYGSALLAHALAEVDRDDQPAYLESSNPRNVPLYERFGFEVIAELQAASSPTIHAMLRPARDER